MADYIDRSELGIGFCNPAVFNDASYGYGWNAAVQIIQDAPAADVVARDCFDKIIAENDDMRAIIDTYGGLENIQSAFVKLHEIETADVRPVVKAKWRYKTMTVPGGKGQTYAKWSCTHCKGKSQYRTLYCPNCGAEMEDGA